MREMFEIYYNDLRNTGSIGGKFLAKETEMLEEAKGVGLPNFLSRPVFLNLLQRLVEQITGRSSAGVADHRKELRAGIQGMGIHRKCHIASN